MIRTLALVALAAGSLLAQNISASLSGRAVDPTGSAVPGAAIVLTHAQTGFARPAEADAEGLFSFRDLAPGSYDLAITAHGFKRYAQPGVELTSGEQRVLAPSRLTLGELAETVSVTAEVAPVQLGSGERAGTLSAEDMERMAIRGRDFFDAVGLLPGVVDLSDGREAPGADSIGNLYILGGRSNQKNFAIDGVTNLDTGSNGSAHGMPSIDSIAEVKVLMSNYAAEFGRNSGGSITIITKGGGRQIRGSAGWYHRHENYSANDFFNNQRGVDRPPYRYNIFSYTLSGPIYWPKKFNKRREKLFFFWSQEFQRQRVNFGSRTVRVPTAIEREGDFSKSMDVNGRLINVYDPFAGTNVVFPGNVVPESRQTQLGRNILNLFPLPNFVDPAPTRLHQWNYLSTLSGPYPRRTEIARVDYNVTPKWVSYLRVNNNIEQQEPPFGLWVAGSVNFPLTATVYRRPGRGATLYNAITVSPSFFSETIFGVSQNKLYYHPRDVERVSRKATGIDIPQWRPDLNPEGFLPNMTFSSVPNYANPSMSNGTPYYNANTIFSLSQNFSKISGRHAVKFGLYFERTRKDQSASVATRGTVSFDRDRNSPLDTNYAYANAITGVYSSYTEANARPQGQFRFSNFEWYVQDAWRVRSRLLLDYGVRAYHDYPQYDARRQLSSFIPGLWNPERAPVLLRPDLDGGRKVALDPLTGRTYPEGLVGTFVPGVGDPANGMATGGVNGWPRGLYEVPRVSLAPRFGFSWDPFGRQRTAVRGGFGYFFDRIQGNPTMGLLSNPPTILTPTVYHGRLETLGDAAGKGILAPGATTTSMMGKHHVPTVYSYSFGVQHQLARRTVLDVSYVASLGRHFLWQRNINPVPLRSNHLDLNPQNRDPSTPSRPLPANFLRPYQGYGNINLFEFASTTNYHSLQVSFDKRMARGWQVGGTYTFSKALGAAATDTTSVSAFFDPRHWDYGPLNYDRTHVASLRGFWQLPKPGKALHNKRLGAIADGWELSSIARFTTGAPFTPTWALVSGSDVTGTPNLTARIVVKDPSLPVLERFAAPERGTWGNAGAGILRGPGLGNVDLSLYRTMKVGERRTLQLRFETYNTANHTQFATISQQARFDAAGAQIDPLFLEPLTSRTPRRIQLAMRLNW